MSKYACVFVVFLAGCANQVSSPEASPSDAFYTWVDDRGQLHSEPRKKSSAQVIPQAETSNADITLNPADYTPAEVVDARLAQKRLYAWTDESGVNHVEERDKPVSVSAESAVPSSVTASENPYPTTCCISLSLQDKLLLSDLKSRALSLEDFYRSDEFFAHGVIVVELDSVPDALRVQSFIQHERVAVPDILLLDERYRVLHYLQAPLSHFVSETWAKLGYLQGLIGSDFLKDVHYVVITPSAKAGVLPLDDKDIKITDFGYVTIFPDAPTL
jgi:hypothetical protein